MEDGHELKGANLSTVAAVPCAEGLGKTNTRLQAYFPETLTLPLLKVQFVRFKIIIIISQYQSRKPELCQR